ncbi:acyl carrier protein [Spiractinospora alimapuensis]|uniref:acyl carrier protein n=1 Tax=Spiractinospora alimapuensis TaxID=2820884 RepID=UPI001F3DCF3D|nr:acyl carrier protein [Spiractinospora alimapuensis]QVQ51822.1 acyl carrier protein [Spiractinospora alimapuensis]
MPERANIDFDSVVKMIEEVSGVSGDSVRKDSLLVEDLDIDSLTMVEIAFNLQREIGIEIPDEKLADVRTPQDLHDLLINGDH